MSDARTHPWLLEIIAEPASARGWRTALWEASATSGTMRQVAILTRSAEGDDDNHHDESAWAASVASAIGACEGSRKVTIVLDSVFCMAVPMRADDLPRRGRRALLLYRMEERLPLPAESLVVDFIDPTGTQTLGVAAEADCFTGWWEALREAGVEILAIVPRALWVAGSVLRDVGAMPDVLGMMGLALDDDAAAESGELAIDWLTLDQQGRVTGWMQSSLTDLSDDTKHSEIGAADPGESRLSMMLKELKETRGPSLRTHLIADGLPWPEEMTQWLAADEVQFDSEPVTFHLGRGPLQQTKGARKTSTRVVINLQRDAWLPPDVRAKSSLGAGARWAVVLAAVLALACGGVFLRAGRYGHIEAEAQIKQEQAFRSVMGSQSAMPVLVTQKLEAVRAERLLTNTGADGSGMKASAYDRLRELMQSLPDSPALPYRFDRLHFEADRVSLNGAVLDYQDADALAAALTRGSADLHYEAVITAFEPDQRYVRFEMASTPQAGILISGVRP